MKPISLLRPTKTRTIADAMREYQTYSGIRPQRIVTTPAIRFALLAEASDAMQYVVGDPMIMGVPVQADREAPPGMVYFRATAEDE